MLVSKDRDRLHHVRKFVTDNYLNWEKFKNDIDSFAGLLVTGGLVHACLAAIKNQSPAVAALANWFANQACPANAVFVCLPGDAAVTAPAEEAMCVKLILLNNQHQAMILQAEAMRYMAQAKLIANAFKTG
ncbi:MAG: hypothetical protein ACOY2B_02260 [Pseudomonadota bacterium]